MKDPFLSLTILEDDLIRLSPVISEDFDNLYQAASNPATWEGHPCKDRHKKDVFHEWFCTMLQGTGALKTTYKPDNQVVGASRFYDYNPEVRSIAVGYTFVSADYWGLKINARMKRLMVDWAKSQGINKVWFHVAASNIRSQNAMEKVGATFSHEAPHQVGARTDIYRFYYILP